MGQTVSYFSGVESRIVERFPVYDVPKQASMTHSQHDRKYSSDPPWFAIAVENLQQQSKSRRILTAQESESALEACTRKSGAMGVERLPFESHEPPLPGFCRRRLRFVCASDTHLRMEEVEVPAGDVFLHTGDIAYWSDCKEHRFVEFNEILKQLPHRHKVVIGGNHDKPLSGARRRAEQWLSAATYLDESGCDIEGLKLWGSARHAVRGIRTSLANAFTDLSWRRLESSRANIPYDVDVLLTHVPPQWILSRGPYLGCPILLQHVMHRVRPFVHVFGHVHSAYGVAVAPKALPDGGAQVLGLGPVFVNASLLGRTMAHPIVFDVYFWAPQES